MQLVSGDVTRCVMACSLWQRAKEKYTICASSERAAKPAHACPEAAAQRADAPRHAAGPSMRPAGAHAPSPQSRRLSTAVSLSRAPWRAAAARAQAADPPLAAQGQPLLGGAPRPAHVVVVGEKPWAAPNQVSADKVRVTSGQHSMINVDARSAPKGPGPQGMPVMHPRAAQWASRQPILGRDRPAISTSPPALFANACAQQAPGPASERTPEGTPACWPCHRHTHQVCIATCTQSLL